MTGPISPPPGGPAGSTPTPRGLVWVGAVIGLAELGFAAVIPLLPLYLTERLGASVMLVGATVATFAAVETVLKTAWGGLADRVGRRPVILGGLLLSSAAPVLMTLLRAPALFVPLRLVDGGGSAALWPCAAAAIVERSPAAGRAASLGMLNMFFLAGLALGPSLGLLVSAAAGTYHAGFYLASALLLAAAVVAAVVFRDEGRDAPGRGCGALDRSSGAPDWGSGTPDPGHEPAARAPGCARDRSGGWAALLPVVRGSSALTGMLAVAFVQMFAVGLLAPILVIYAHDVVGLSDRALGVLFLIIVLAVAAASVPGGQLADRIGRARTVAWGMVAASAGMWALSLAGRNLPVLAAAAVLLGGSYAVSSPAWLALMSDAAPEGRTGLVMGASETAQGAGLVIGPLAGGLLYDRVGAAAPFAASAVLLTLGTALAITVALKRR